MWTRGVAHIATKIQPEFSNTVYICKSVPERAVVRDKNGRVLAQTGASQDAVCFWAKSTNFDTCDICESSVPGRGMLGVYPARHTKEK